MPLSPEHRWICTPSPWIGAALTLALGGQASLRAQDLVGCQLQDGTLQCVPGLDATPQQQIRILRGEIAADQQLEGAVEQRIEGLQQLVLQGEARVGALLQASLQGEAAAELAAMGPALQYHWYRLAPGRSQWERIPEAQGASYTPTSNDIAYQVMVVVVRSGGGTTQRVASAPVGPVRVGVGSP
ncbi:MAG: hypothetical protein ACKO5F_13485 [Synechococcus sp.]